MRFLSALILAFLLAAPARAEVTEATSDHMLITQMVEIDASPARAWRALGRIGSWWNGEHSYSGDARNMTLDVRAGGCFCERWSGGEVEHGRVIYASPAQGILRLDAALGPMQARGIHAVWTFTLVANGPSTRVTMTYLALGASTSTLDVFAPAVDGVLAEQMARFKHFVETGAPL